MSRAGITAKSLNPLLYEAAGCRILHGHFRLRDNFIDAKDYLKPQGFLPCKRVLCCALNRPRSHFMGDCPRGGFSHWQNGIANGWYCSREGLKTAYTREV
jgi:hypothetical protein